MLHVSVTFWPFSGINLQHVKPRWMWAKKYVYSCFICCILMPDYGQNMTKICIIIMEHNKIVMSDGNL